MQVSFRSAWLAGCFTAMVITPVKPVPVADGAKVAVVAQAAVEQPSPAEESVRR
jgi:hypothetical protein